MERTWDLIWCSALSYVIINYKLYIDQFDFTEVPDGFLHRLSDVTPREWAIRVYATLTGKGAPYLALRAGHSLFSIIGVACGDAPERYPPLFGSWKETYRVRRFYVSVNHLFVSLLD